MSEEDTGTSSKSSTTIKERYQKLIPASAGITR